MALGDGNMIPRWTRRDETNLRRRVQRVAKAPPAEPCQECIDDNHRHHAAQIGPYTICRCLRCPVLVVA